MEYTFVNNINTPDTFLSANPSYEGVSIFSTMGSFSSGFITKRLMNGCWAVIFSKHTTDYQNSIHDFVNYENANGRRVLIHSMENRSILEELIKQKPVRAIPNILIHSTNKAIFSKILKDKKLIAPCFIGEKKRWNYGNEPSEIERYLDNEPEEYKKFVMLEEMNGNSELVMCMYQHKSFNVTEETCYEPGVRFYLNARKMHEDGILVFDGVHLAKVYKKIDFDKYLEATIRIDDLETRELWNPKIFQDMSNKYYEKKCLTIG